MYAEVCTIAPGGSSRVTLPVYAPSPETKKNFVDKHSGSGAGTSSGTPSASIVSFPSVQYPPSTVGGKPTSAASFSSDRAAPHSLEKGETARITQIAASDSPLPAATPSVAGGGETKMDETVPFAGPRGGAAVGPTASEESPAGDKNEIHAAAHESGTDGSAAVAVVPVVLVAVVAAVAVPL
ncbi:hypothetical protein DQ04_18551000 [Trypanosoma grayi]|uniref:hypothetical protein n=1 Tax=Trypanosoma grayi TaxID=71804 RepID=UPI0004F3F1F5|nr:hypothetical protein DQ04_18551000 [Trypanosoma grayi]KEG05775.1 hypothetical protein DQ04_18551000 [Trypanosoma grayi]